MLPHTLKAAALAVALLVVPARSWAIEINVPCATPSVFSGAAVNVVVLPFSQPPSLSNTGAGTGEQIGALVQLETLLAIAKYGSVGLVQLVGNPSEECSPEEVLDKLTGRKPGAAERMREGGGLILIWGRIFESGPDLFLQSYIRFLRHGIDESIEIAVEKHTLRGRLSTQAFACAPRKIERAVLDDVRRQFASGRLMHEKPDAESPGVKMPEGAGPYWYWITDVRGDWAQLEPMERSTNTTRRYARGWVLARADQPNWPMRELMPELRFVEGVAGYLAARVRSGGPVAATDSYLQSAGTAIDAYLENWGDNALIAGAAATSGTPLAVAMPRQLRGFVSILRTRGSDDGLIEARTQFERAATLVPHSGNARSLLAIARMAVAFRRPSDDQPPRRFVDDLRIALGADPDNRDILTNLGAAYDLLLMPAAGRPPSWSLAAADRDELSRQREALRPLLAQR